MIDFEKGYSLEEYFTKGYEEERDRQRRACERTVYSEAFEDAVKKVKKTVMLAAFAEIYCPDTVVVMPFVKRMTDLNPLVRLGVFERDPYMKEMEAMTGTARIPTLLFFDEEMNLRGKYVELPDGLKDKMKDADPGERSAMGLDYRRGKYNALIQEQLAEILSLFH